MLIIDTHAHIYGDDAKKYPVMEKPFRPPPGKGTLAHLRQETKEAGVSHVVAIHTRTYYNFDNRFLVDAAKSDKDFMVGVVLLDSDDPHSPGLLEKHVRESNITAVRSIPSLKTERLDDPGVVKLWETALKLGIGVNVLMNWKKRDELTALLTRFRKLNVVLDHCMDLKVGPDYDNILRAVLQLSRQPNLHAKLSYLPVVGDKNQDYPFKEIHDATRQIIKAYSPDRCVWGSDFPCELWCPRVTYAKHLALFTRELGLDQADQEAILGKTARRLSFAHVKG